MLLLTSQFFVLNMYNYINQNSAYFPHISVQDITATIATFVLLTDLMIRYFRHVPVGKFLWLHDPNLDDC